MTPDQKQKFMEAAVSCIGAPYVWQGKGAFLWTPSGLKQHNFGVPVFDCSGLVTHCLWVATSVDHRATHSAQVLFDTQPDGLDLLFYGKDTRHVSHVAINVDHSNVQLVIEASGGDHTTTSTLIAFERGAKVGFHFARRTDFLGSRGL